MRRSLLLAMAGAMILFFMLSPARPLAASSPILPVGRVVVDPAAPFVSPSAAPGDPEPIPVEFTLLKDEVDPSGRWVQTFRMLVKPGGTLADASEAVFGNLDHVEELFAALKKQHPELRGPAQVPAGATAEITLDPRVAFVPKAVASDPTRGATIYTYYNGARRVVYDPKQTGDLKGLSLLIELPLDRPTKTFTILEDNVPREVPAGVRIAYYEFRDNDNFKRVVGEVYGTDSVRAIHDFLEQTRWDPNRWPPSARERQQRLVVPLSTSFEDEKFVPIDVSAGNPASGDLLKKQMDERSKAGIYALRRQPYGTVYRVVANDFNLTARQVSKLLYDDEDEYLAIAAQAGFASLYDLRQNPPEDVRLFGRSFDVLVDYERERFLARPPTLDPQLGKRTTLLLNGTLIEEWQVEQGKSGLLRQIILPSGYRKMLYRPNSITALGSQILYSLISLGRSSGNPEVRQEDEGRFISRLIWDWGRSLPKPSGEVLDYGRLIVTPIPDTDKVDQLLEFASRPALRDGLGTPPFYSAWLGNPFVMGAAAVLVALLTLGTFNWVARRV